METQTQNFNQLFKEYYTRSFLFARSYVHVCEVAEDIASESLVVMWERMQVEEILSPKSFLFKVVRNKSLDYLKHQKIRVRVVQSIDDWDGKELQVEALQRMDNEIFLAKEIAEITLETIAYLPLKTKEVFVLSRHQELSGKEIADQLGITVKGVEYHITKALKTLSVSLRDYLVV